MEHDISHIKDIGDIMNIFFNSRIYTNQSFVNALFGKQQKTTRSQDIASAQKTNQKIIDNAGTQINAKTSEYMSTGKAFRGDSYEDL